VTIENRHRVLEGWMPETREKDFCEPMQQAFIDRDCPDGVLGALQHWKV